MLEAKTKPKAKNVAFREYCESLSLADYNHLVNRLKSEFDVSIENIINWKKRGLPKGWSAALKLLTGKNII